MGSSDGESKIEKAWFKVSGRNKIVSGVLEFLTMQKGMGHKAQVETEVKQEKGTFTTIETRLVCWEAAIAAAAKSLQSYLTLCNPSDGSPPGSAVPGVLQARILESVAISFSNAWKWKVKVKSLSRVQLCATPWTAAHQAPLPMGFSRQEYWSGVPLPSCWEARRWKLLIASSYFLHNIATS